MQSESGLDQQFVPEIVFVLDENGHVRGVVHDIALRVIDRVIFVVRVVSDHVDANLQETFSQVVVEPEIESETVHGAFPRVEAGVFKLGLVLGIGQRTLNGGGRVARHDEEIGTDTPVVPTIFGYRTVIHPVVVVKSENIPAGTVPGGQGQLAVKIKKSVRQPFRILHIRIENLGGLFQERAFSREDETDGGLAVIFEFQQRALKQQLRPDIAQIHFAGESFLVAVARFDVHHGRQASAELRTEAARVNVRTAHDIHVENGKNTDGVEGVVQNRAVKQKHVLHGSTTAHIELAALVAGGYNAGQHLQILREIRLSSDGRHLTHVFGCHADDRCPGFLFLSRILTDNLHSIKGLRIR